jgi:hypothetical protein
MLEIVSEAQLSSGKKLEKRIEIAVSKVVDLEVAIVMVVTEKGQI